jgi:2-keto-4-pentenoate hydratase/2-oxohepta-3-ene-1,7-dioic acid hydratase in catechol pathway
MRLATFRVGDDGPRVGAVVADDHLLDLAAATDARHGAADPAFASMLALIDGGDPALDRARGLVDDPVDEATVRLDGVELLAPLPEPRQIRDFLSFEAHLRNCYDTVERFGGPHQEIPPVWYQQPIYYKANRFSVVGPEAPVRWPAYSQMMDYELELACVIGRTGVDIAREDALDHVVGFTIFNDVSARDTQGVEMAGTLGPAKSKDFDTGNVFGPWLVTLDEIDDLYDLTMVARVNGEEWSRGSTATMHHRFEDLIAFVSRSETLHAGEILGSGTVGTGCGLEHGRFLQPGDVVELEIDGLGVLRNQIGVAAPAA